MSKEQTDADIAQNDFVEKYIAELQWHDSTSQEVRDAVTCNIRGFWSCVSASNNELRKRYNEARALVKRCTDGYYRDGDEDSETIDEVMSDALHWVSQEELEDTMFG